MCIRDRFLHPSSQTKMSSGEAFSLKDRTKVAEKGPIKVEVKAGQTYYWCSCGLSKNQPFCDGSHSQVGLAPLPYTPTEDKTVYLCACKQTNNAPFCDGTHGKITA
eukprot:TRINITY_DN529_c0_g1_i1.p1 TRINITY_DN529_c0_g1~~TRINITY_DN529_c0_g1_i1.p1  ORF type:complete len:106 (+),score=18.35 TRINITY_DN529_c0_g1_i1:52-369(+)